MQLLKVLTSFAATGAIGELRPLVSLRDVAGSLGPPADAGRVDQKRHWPHLFRYGDVVLEVCGCRLITRVNLMTHYDSVDLPLGPGGELLELTARTPFPAFSTSLASAGVEVRETQRLDTQFTLRTAVGADRPELPDIDVHFTFVDAQAINRDGPDTLLYGTGARVWDHDCAPPPEGDLDDGFGP